MTKKDYIKLADAFRVAYNRAVAHDFPEGHTRAQNAVMATVALVMNALESDNPRFDREKFEVAIYGE